MLYRLRLDPSNQSLRYSLRSLANVEHGQVYVVGHCPPWLTNVEHIGTSTARGKWRRGLDALAIGTRELDGHSVLLIDDDMWVLQPTEPQVYRAAGTLLDHAFEKRGSYQRSLWLTDSWLRSRGVAEPVSYELHVPMPIDCSVAAPWLAEAAADTGRIPVQGRSLYGNLANLGGTELLDVKRAADDAIRAYGSGGAVPWPEWRALLARLFPEPSLFERDG